jgi:carboxypeptidase Q
VHLRSFLLLLLVAIPLSAQGPGGARRVLPRDPNADPIPMDSLPAYVRRDAITNPVLQRIWAEGMENSQAMRLMQPLLDSLGHRLTASPEMEAAQQYIMNVYQSWGVTARREAYGSYEGWRRGVTHVDLIAPRVRTLEAHALSWSPSTGGRPIEAEVVTFPANVTTPEEFDAWLPNVRGKIFLLNIPQYSCRSAAQWAEFGTPDERARVDSMQRARQAAWTRTNTAMGGAAVQTKLKAAGAVAVFSSTLTGQNGVQRVFGSIRQTLPTFGIGCEDYGLLFRLAENGQGPRVRAFTDSERLGEKQVFNVIAEIRGSEKPNEYVILSAHFDTHSGSSGATDNGTGTVTMMEAVRILRQTYPNPKRTILVGHWSGEEQGLNGSRAFTEDHPEIVNGLQALWNQDNGTGRITQMTAGPFPGAARRIEQYLGQLPRTFSQQIRFTPTSGQSTGGTDHSSFVCHKAPAFNLGALSWDYGGSTWHTDRDTYDKVVEYDLKANATLVAMLTYLASEDPERMPRDVMDPLPPRFGTNTPGTWAPCSPATRNSATSTR